MMIRKVVIEGGVVIGSGVIVVGPGGGIWYRYTRHNVLHACSRLGVHILCRAPLTI